LININTFNYLLSFDSNETLRSGKRKVEFHPHVTTLVERWQGVRPWLRDKRQARYRKRVVYERIAM